VAKDAEENLQETRGIAFEAGAQLIGVADLRNLKGIYSFPPDLLSGFRFGISIGVGLDNHGTYDDSAEDRYAFPLLNNIAERICDHAHRLGYKAKRIAADERVEERPPLRWKGEISHKAVAKAAGLGWIGRSMLLVTPDMGPRVCLTTVVTDMPLVPGEPRKNNCGSCSACISACPIGALKKRNFEDHPELLEEVLDVDACDTRVEARPRGTVLCYECMLACPIGMGHQERKRV